MENEFDPSRSQASRNAAGQIAENHEHNHLKGGVSMYEEYTKQSLPDKQYRELLGTAICVFNSNNGFIIENILRSDADQHHSWYDLIDETSGKLLKPIKETITKNSDTEIAKLFEQLVSDRNRIIHSYRVTDKNGEQVLYTKNKDHVQYEISKELLMEFIKNNDKLSDMLHEFRGY